MLDRPPLGGQPGKGRQAPGDDTLPESRLVGAGGCGPTGPCAIRGRLPDEGVAGGFGHEELPPALRSLVSRGAHRTGSSVASSVRLFIDGSEVARRSRREEACPGRRGPSDLYIGRSNRRANFEERSMRSRSTGACCPPMRPKRSLFLGLRVPRLSPCTVRHNRDSR